MSAEPRSLEGFVDKEETGFSSREKEIIEMILQGKSANVIAKELGINYHAIIVIRQGVFGKMAVAITRINVMVKLGIIEPKIKEDGRFVFTHGPTYNLFWPKKTV